MDLTELTEAVKTLTEAVKTLLDSSEKATTQLASLPAELKELIDLVPDVVEEDPVTDPVVEAASDDPDDEAEVSAPEGVEATDDDAEDDTIEIEGLTEDGLREMLTGVVKDVTTATTGRLPD